MQPDVFMLKFDEPDAATHLARLQTVASHAVLIESASGIHAAYAECARRASTSHFFIVDADSWVLDGFSFQLDFEPRSDQVAVWRARNPVNGLVYGHGGIKLIPKTAFDNLNERTLDMSTRLTPHYRTIPVVASEHRFNMTPLTTWRAAFRECVKLASGLFDDAGPTPRRLAAWCSTANAERHSAWCLRGACDGRDYGSKNSRHPEKLNLINNYDWLKEQFVERYELTAVQSRQAEDTTAVRS